MSNVNGPLIIRHAPQPYLAKPGLHSHNLSRRPRREMRPSRGPIWAVRMALLFAGLALLGYYGYSLSNQYIYQAYQNWAFDQEIAGRHVTFGDFVRERTPFGFLAGAKGTPAPATAAAPPSTPGAPAVPPEGALLGRVEIPRLNLSGMVRQGVDAKTLAVAVGHVPSTSLAGQPGNFAIAAHRDTLFRALKDIRRGDLVSFQSPSGTYTYQVLATKIVKPTDVSVLRPDGGALIPEQTGEPAPASMLTMITCYPFYYVGSAPKRFIVEAKLVGSDQTKAMSLDQSDTAPPPKHAIGPANPGPVHTTSSSRELRHSRSSSRLQPAESLRGAHPRRVVRPKPVKKRNFWHKLFRA